MRKNTLNYTSELEGQVEFYENFIPLVDNRLTTDDILKNHTDGIVNGNLLEFKLLIQDLNIVLGQAIRYLSAMRLKGEPIPKNILLISINSETAYLYDSNDYLESIEKVYIGAASLGISGFSSEIYKEKIDYSENMGKLRIVELLREENFTKINIDENCIVGWAEKYYREYPNSSKSSFIGDLSGKTKIIGEIRQPTKFKRYIHPYEQETNIKFQYLMDRLNDSLRKKDLGAFYTPIEYSKKSYDLLYKAIERVPEGNDYVIIDRCAGTGNLQLNLPDEILSKCILSTVEYYEYKVLLELLSDKVKFIIPPFDEKHTFYDGLVRGADALDKEYVYNDIFLNIINNPKMTIILFENPPYAEVNGTTRGSQSKAKWKESYIASKMNKEIKGSANNDLANLFIWSGFKYFLRQDTDSYVVYAPIKYWKSQHLINKLFLGGYAFNRKHFHAKTEAMISCILWSNENANLNEITLEAFDLIDNLLVNQGKLIINRVYTTFSKKYYDKRVFKNDELNGIVTGLDGVERTKDGARAKKIWNENIVGYLVANSQGFDNPRLNSGLVVANRYDGNGFVLRDDNFLEKLPLFAAGKYTDHVNDWKIMSNVMKSGDGYKDFYRKINSVEVQEKLYKILFWASLTHYSHIRSLSGNDGRLYRNQLCLDDSNGETLAMKELKNYRLNQDEKELLKQYRKVLKYAKATKRYNKSFTYGTYQIDEELNTFVIIQNLNTRTKIYDYPELNGELNALKENIKKYYLKEIPQFLFEYKFLV